MQHRVGNESVFRKNNSVGCLSVRPLKKAAVAALLLSSQVTLGVSTALADATFVMQRKEAGSVTNEMKMWVRGHQMRVGQIEGMTGYLLYDQKARTITQIDDKQKVYRVVDEQAIAQLKTTLAGLQSSVMKQLEGLPRNSAKK